MYYVDGAGCFVSILYIIQTQLIDSDCVTANNDRHFSCLVTLSVSLLFLEWLTFPMETRVRELPDGSVAELRRGRAVVTHCQGGRIWLEDLIKMYINNLTFANKIRWFILKGINTISNIKFDLDFNRAKNQTLLNTSLDYFRPV